jgi:hypothetical protein
MNTRVSGLGNICGLGGTMFLLSAAALLALAGCERPLQPGETYHKLTVAWPLFDVEKSEGVENDLTWTKEQGDAGFWLASWNVLRKFDKGGDRVYRKERKTFIPFYNVNVEEGDQFRKTWGSILFYPYRSYRTYDQTGAAHAVPPMEK